ncbi:hypothetical protein SEA_MEYRAN_14 [Gordonia phage Meyran]|nr:hypothetical protein SEA_PHISHY_15 [Gordonia phage Phishy]UVF60366.1 hypothetical protein SEA_MEYRAN_14 [Gordonia phage Meyran]
MAVRVMVHSAEARRQAHRTSFEQRARIAHRVVDEARSEAPVLTGDYRDGMGVQTSASGADVLLVDTDPDAIHKEWGTSKTPAHMTMVNAAARYGAYSGRRRRR